MVRAYPDKCTITARPRSTWKWKYMFRGIAISGDRVEEGEEVGDIQGASSDGYCRPPSDFVPTSDLPPPPFVGKTRKRRKTIEAFYKVYGVVYLPGDTKGLTDKLHLLSAEFFAGSMTGKNELVHVLDALLRLKALTRR